MTDSRVTREAVEGRKRLDSIVRQIEGRCHHFNGTQNECCKVGVNYLELAGPNEGMALRMPCTNPAVFAKRREELGYKLAECAKLQRTTHEEAEQEAAEMIGHSDKMMVAMVAAHKDAKEKGLRKGNGGRSSMPCPLECGKTLHYTVASYNGHMHAQCETKGCAAWME